MFRGIKISDLKERVLFLTLQSHADGHGREYFRAQKLGTAWTKIIALSRPKPQGPDDAPAPAFYKVFLRAQPGLTTETLARASLNALVWKNKILHILGDFRPHPKTSAYWETYGAEFPETAERFIANLTFQEPHPKKDAKNALDASCQLNLNEDNMKYKNEFESSEDSKQKLKKQVKDRKTQILRGEDHAED